MVRVLVLGVLISLGAGVAAAQSRPDFSGTWALTSSFPSTSSSSRLEIAQDDSAITIDGRRYALDGSETREALSPTRARTAWASSALEIRTATEAPRGEFENVFVYSLDATGRLVVVSIKASLVPRSMNTSVSVYARSEP